MFSQYITSRKEAVYGHDAKEFRPERWESGELAEVGWGYSPFGGGPRRCLGEDFALMEVSYTLVSLLQLFPTIALSKGEDVVNNGSGGQKLSLTLSSADGCRVYVRQRTR